jgi:thioredoxin reductase (NADPH)
MSTFDAVVIGGGPAGLTAALYLLRSQVRTALVEKLAPGGQMLKTERIENYPGFPDGILGYELSELMNAHVERWRTPDFTRINDDVRQLIPGGRSHRLLVGGEWIETKTIIICAGSSYRKLGIPGEVELTGKGVSYCALCDGNFFRGQSVAVIGGGNAALEEALYLTRLVDRLYLIHRRDEFRGARCYQDKCFIHPKMTVLRSTVAERVVGRDAVTGLSVRNVKTGEERVLDVQGVFVFVGFVPGADFLPIEIERDAQDFVLTDQEMQTSVPGIFAAGDIRGKLTRQVASAVGDAAVAASSALRYLETYEPA